MQKDEKWFSSIKWDDACLTCKSETNGICRNRGCAESNYDPWGDPIPAHIYQFDGNSLNEYLEEKRKRLESANHTLSEIDLKIENSLEKMLKNRPPILTEYYIWLVNNEKSYNSIKTYMGAIISFLTYKYGNSIPNEFYIYISSYNVSKYLETLPSQTYKATVWSALRSFFEYLIPRYLYDNPIDSIKRPHIDKDSQTTYLTPNEVNTILNNAKNLSNDRMKNRDLCILMLGFQCGLKTTNLLSANTNDIDWNKKCIVFHEKNQNVFEVPLSDNILHYLRLWLLDRQNYFNTTSSALFVTQLNKRITSDTLAKILKKYSVGIDKNISPRIMRNTFIITLYQNTKDLQLCARYLNLKSTSSVLRYIEQLTPNNPQEKVTTIMENIYSNESNENFDVNLTTPFGD